MTTLDTLLPGLTDAANAAARTLPTPSPLTAGDVLTGDAANAGALPGAGARAVSAHISGSVEGTIALLLSAEIAAAVENGPVGPQSLVNGLEPALTDAISAIGAQFDSPQELAAELVLTGEADTVAIPLTDGQAHLATLVIIAAPAASVPQGIEFESLSPHATANGNRSLDLLSDVEMGVSVELGRTRMNVRELLNLAPGSVVELDRAAGSPVDLLVNGTLIARGEVVVIDEEFGIRITEIVGQDNIPGAH